MNLVKKRIDGGLILQRTSMNLPMIRILSIVSWIFLLFTAGTVRADGRLDPQRMLDSVVFIQCDVEFRGEPIIIGSGTGFLIANSEYVITNNHVIDQCHSDNKIAVLKEHLERKFVAALQNEAYTASVAESFVEELRQNPTLLAKLQNDPQLARKYFVEYVAGIIDEISSKQAKTDSHGIGQELSVAYMAKEVSSPIRVDVLNIVWTSSKGHEQARETGMDVAILRLARPLLDKPSVTFATGASAQVNDTVYAVGFPSASGEAVDSAKYVPTMKKGIVSKLGGESPYATDAAKARGWKGVGVIETDAAISQGNSGGPLYNEYGEVLGINSFISSKAAGVGWAQDIAIVIPVLQSLGLPLPPVVDKRRTWIDKNQTLLWAGTGAAVFAIALYFLFRRRHAPQPDFGSRKTPKPDKSAVPVAGKDPQSTLRGIRGEYAGTSVPVPAAGLVLGRGSKGAGQLTFGDDSGISRRHCLITYIPHSRQFEVTDLGSTNGTFILPGDKRLEPNQKTMCRPGQIIRLGRKNEFELVLR